jgi:chaperonin GroEL
MKERKDRVDDALSASRAAATDGYVPGGGVAYLRAKSAVLDAAKSIDTDESLGYSILASALEAPCWHIADNCGLDGDVVVEKVLEQDGAFGFNAGTNTYEDLIVSGIIDPTLVVRTALRNAASVAGLMLTTEVAITDLKDDVEPTGNAVV